MLTLTAIDASAQILHGGVVTIGNFDGLHLGHKALLTEANRYPGPRTLITFDPHPIQVLYPERGLARLFPREDLNEQLPKLGMDALVLLPFTRQFAALTATEFLDGYLGAFKPKHVVAGYDFGFGHSRGGGLEQMRAWGERSGCQVHVVGPVTNQGDVVSSRLLRELVRDGNVERAAELLGRPFYVRGVVGEGAGRGRKLGFPTMNLQPVNEILPKNGVYATRAHVAGREYPSVTNIGVNPTFSGRDVKVETHIPGHQVEARGARVDIEFLRRLRDERKFNSIEDLKKQIEQDILNAR